jgi:hypothetical protein
MSAIAKIMPTDSIAEECLRSGYWEMLHNVSLFSPIYGPIGIFEGLPYYCDGRQLVVSGYSIGDSSVPVEKRAVDLIRMILDETENTLEVVEYWGPEKPVRISSGQSLRFLGEQPANCSNRDVILSLCGVNRRLLQSRRDVRRALRNGLRVEICAKKRIVESHRQIVRAFLQHRILDAEDKKYIDCWPTSVKAPDSVLFNVYRGETLTGFAIISQFGTRVATYAYGFFDNTCAGTSDLAHAAMVDFCIEHSFEKLDLGYSIHSQLLRYKLKWGEVTLVAPPWCIRWVTDELRTGHPAERVEHTYF